MKTRYAVIAVIAAIAAAGRLQPAMAPAATSISYAPAQAAAGAKIFAQNCAQCHGAQLQGVSAPALKGRVSGIAEQSVGEVYTYVTSQMPLTNPGGLPKEQYIDVVAFLLKANGRAAGAAKLSEATAKTSTATVLP